MNCPKCNTELAARVITDQFDGDYNLTICPGCGTYCERIEQTPLIEIFKIRARISDKLLHMGIAA